MKVLKCISISAALFAALSLCATNAATKEELLKPVNRFYDWANNTYGVAGAAPASAQSIHDNLHKIFGPEIVHRLNGKIVASSVEDLFKRFLRLRNKYDYVLVDRPFKEILVDTEDNKVAIRYKIHFHLKNGDDKNIYALTIFKIKNDQLIEFNEISSVMNDHL